MSDTNSKYFSRYKQSWSKPVNEDDIINHLSLWGGTILCGIDKRFPDVYNSGTKAIVHLEENRVMICKSCFKIWKKHNN